jgi:hypothetical protein
VRGQDRDCIGIARWGSNVRRFCFCSVLLAVAALLGAPRLASANARWMSEAAMRADFIGGTLQGFYRDGRTWVASYAGSGRYEVREGERHAVGIWYFRGQAFCFHYGPPHWPLLERCGAVAKLSANCYQFHFVFPGSGPEPPREEDFRPLPVWSSRGWRQQEPSTCEEKPIA